MITQEMIDRINELYHKSQGPGLSTEEKFGGIKDI